MLIKGDKITRENLKDLYPGNIITFNNFSLPITAGYFDIKNNDILEVIEIDETIMLPICVVKLSDCGQKVRIDLTRNVTFICESIDEYYSSLEFEEKLMRNKEEENAINIKIKKQAEKILNEFGPEGAYKFARILKMLADKDMASGIDETFEK